jgi:hypothetical protein
MGKLHEVLAVEGELEGAYKKILEETKTTFGKKAEHFIGHLRTYSPFKDEDTEKVPEERKEMVTTVNQKLDYLWEHVVRYLDAVAQKEVTNQKAVADLVVGDVTLAKNLPATFLLGLENKLKQWKEVLDQIPTLSPGVEWKPDEGLGKDIFRMVHPEQVLRTKKAFKCQILVAPTDKHPAQIEKWNEEVPVGTFSKAVWSGMLSPSQKSDLLGRLDTLSRAVKQARQRANSTEVEKVEVGQVLVKYLMG